MERDTSCLYYIAKALMSLQEVHGTIPHVKCKGNAAATVQRIMARMRREMGTEAPGPAGRYTQLMRSASPRHHLYGMCSIR